MAKLDEYFDDLVADLALVFQRHFRMQPTVLGPSGEDSTPFVAFVIATCAELSESANTDVRITAAQISDAGRRRGVKEDV